MYASCLKEHSMINNVIEENPGTIFTELLQKCLVGRSHAMAVLNLVSQLSEEPIGAKYGGHRKTTLDIPL